MGALKFRNAWPWTELFPLKAVEDWRASKSPSGGASRLVSRATRTVDEANMKHSATQTMAERSIFSTYDPPSWMIVEPSKSMPRDKSLLADPSS